MDKLVGAGDIAKRLGVKRQAVHNWRERHRDFPQPEGKIEGGLVWYWPDVEAWARKTGRYPPK